MTRDDVGDAVHAIINRCQHRGLSRKMVDHCNEMFSTVQTMGSSMENHEPDTPPPEYEETEQVPCVEKSMLPGAAVAMPLIIPPEYTAIELAQKLEKAGAELRGKDEDGDAFDGATWSELSCGLRLVRVGLIVAKMLALLTLLYLFICSLDFLSSAFRLVGGKMAGEAFSSNSLLQNPVSGLMIGILATVLVQSSSTSTSIVVTMVASGILEVRPAIPIIMGANIGTSVTNTVVSLAQSGDREEFRRAFAGATVHDMFNWLSVIVLLPLEAATGYLFHLTSAIVSSYNLESSAAKQQDLLKKLTKPFTEMIVQLDKKVIEGIALGREEDAHKSLIKHWCGYEEVVLEQNVTVFENVTLASGGWVMQNFTELQNVTEKVPVEECHFLLRSLGLSDLFTGLILLAFSLFLLCICLILMVKLLHSMLQGRIAKVIKNTLNADLPGKLAYFTDYIAILIGAGMTILVQSSSVFTSAMTPLVGMGVIELERMYPLTLGSNIGTTATGLLAAMAASSDKLGPSLQIALCHLFFNISGILLYFPIPKSRFPIPLAKLMGRTTAKYRWFAIFYLIIMFVVVPAAVFGLSMMGTIPMLVIVGLFMLGLLVITIINILQRKRPEVLCSKLQNWDFLPEPLHSLDPLDRIITKITSVCTCCQRCHQPSHEALPTDSLTSSQSSSGTATPRSCHSTSILIHNKASVV